MNGPRQCIADKVFSCMHIAGEVLSKLDISHLFSNRKFTIFGYVACGLYIDASPDPSDTAVSGALKSEV